MKTFVETFSEEKQLRYGETIDAGVPKILLKFKVVSVLILKFEECFFISKFLAHKRVDII